MTHSQNDWEMAVHEAGHAVIGIAEGLNIERASVAKAPDGVRLGRVWGLIWPAVAQRGFGTPAEILECSRLAREILAGPIATLEFYPGAFHGGTEDFKQLENLAAELFAKPEEIGSWKGAINDEVWELVRRYRGAIQQVAHDLLNKGDQRGPELRATFAAASPVP